MLVDAGLYPQSYHVPGKIDDKLPQTRVCYLEGINDGKGLKICMSDSSRILRGFRYGHLD